MKRKAGYFWKQINKHQNPLVMECIKDLLISREDPWAADLLKIEDEIGICIANNALKEVYSQITHAAAVFVLGCKQGFESLNQMPQPRNWFTLPDYVNDSWQSKALCMVQAGNSKLGNRMKNIHGKQWKECPWCLKEGESETLRNSDIIILLGYMSSERTRGCGRLQKS